MKNHDIKFPLMSPRKEELQLNIDRGIHFFRHCVHDIRQGGYKIIDDFCVKRYGDILRVGAETYLADSWLTHEYLMLHDIIEMGKNTLEDYENYIRFKVNYLDRIQLAVNQMI